MYVFIGKCYLSSFYSFSFYFRTNPFLCAIVRIEWEKWKRKWGEEGKKKRKLFFLCGRTEYKLYNTWFCRIFSLSFSLSFACFHTLRLFRTIRHITCNAVISTSVGFDAAFDLLVAFAKSNPKYCLNVVNSHSTDKRQNETGVSINRNVENYFIETDFCALFSGCRCWWVGMRVNIVERFHLCAAAAAVCGCVCVCSLHLPQCRHAVHLVRNTHICITTNVRVHRIDLNIYIRREISIWQQFHLSTNEVLWHTIFDIAPRHLCACCLRAKRSIAQC